MDFGSLVFLNSWMLFGLLALPILWWLLKVIPPTPVRLYFPAIGLLMGLNSREQSASSSPWWLIFLRIAMIAFLIIALSKPVLDPDAALSGRGPVIIVVDDGWHAAPGWHQKTKSLNSLLDLAERSGRNIILQTTTVDYDGNPPYFSGVITPMRAKIFLERLKPKPWAPNYTQAMNDLTKLEITTPTTIVWASDGVENTGVRDMVGKLSRLGELTILLPQPNDQPLLVKTIDEGADKLEISVQRFNEKGSLNHTLVAQDDEGTILGHTNILFSEGELKTKGEFNLPLELQNQITRISLGDNSGIGGMTLLDERWQRRPIGIVRESMADQGLMLLSENYYLERALKPLGALSQASVEILLKAGQSVILLPDMAPLSSDDRQSLNNWVQEGGVLIRFAGPNLANNLKDNLVSVPLRKGGRVLGGAMLWTKPQKLASFKDASPFFGLNIPDDAIILRQVLADPSPELEDKTWAKLKDDTPLVTADKRGDGWVVLFHTTANAEWSNIALSGLFVNMLERLISLSEGVGLDEASNQPLSPLQLYNGFGAVMPSGGAAISIVGPLDDQFILNAEHPPGFYGTKIYKRAFNLADYVTLPTAFSDMPGAAFLKSYSHSKALDLSGWLLALTLFLLSLDTILTLNLRGQLFNVTSKVIQSLVVACVIGGAFKPTTTLAQNRDDDYFALQASMGTVLAYIETGDNRIDRTSLAGLRGLSLILNQRTAVEAAQPMGIDPAQDDLAFFPLIYWPITETQAPLKPFAIEQLNDYLANGGTLLIDTRDQQLGVLGNKGASHLQRLAEGLNIPALQQLPPRHVLGKSFYLLKEFPGRWRGNDLWVDAPGSQANDGVSLIVIGGNDWAGAWAVDDAGRALFPIIPGGDDQRELAYRFGVNLVMYTLTGNYKADQVHIPAILERLGQ